jgi:hypothetical protein
LRRCPFCYSSQTIKGRTSIAMFCISAVRNSSLISRLPNDVGKWSTELLYFVGHFRKESRNANRLIFQISNALFSFFFIAHTAYEKKTRIRFQIRKITCFLVYNHEFPRILLWIRVFFSYAVCAIRNGLMIGALHQYGLRKRFSRLRANIRNLCNTVWSCYPLYYLHPIGT